MKLIGLKIYYTLLCFRRFAGIASENRKTPNLQLEFLSNYLAELTLLDYDCIRFLPSVVATSTSSLCECSGYNSVELKERVLIVHDLYLLRRVASYNAIRRKYKQQSSSTCQTCLPLQRYQRWKRRQR